MAYICILLVDEIDASTGYVSIDKVCYTADYDEPAII